MPEWTNENPGDVEFNLNKRVSARVAGVLVNIGFKFEAYHPTTRTFVLDPETDISCDGIRRTVTYRQG